MPVVGQFSCACRVPEQVGKSKISKAMTKNIETQDSPRLAPWDPLESPVLACLHCGLLPAISASPLSSKKPQFQPWSKTSVNNRNRKKNDKDPKELRGICLSVSHHHRTSPN